MPGSDSGGAPSSLGAGTNGADASPVDQAGSAGTGGVGIGGSAGGSGDGKVVVGCARNSTLTPEMTRAYRLRLDP
jgi:hypothetical protein